jgi:aldose 1-epimerase
VVDIQLKNDKNIGEYSQVILKRKGIEVTLFSYGASLYSLKINNQEMTFRPDDLHEFFASEFYYGKTVGRTAGRLIAPSYTIDGVTYPVTSFPPGKTKLHGGKSGFSFQNFDIIEHQDNAYESFVTFRYVSPDGEEEYPGELTLTVRYTIDDNGNLRIDYNGTSSKDTLCNITNHTYFNLSQDDNILNHKLQIDASKRVEIDNDLLPKERVGVIDTPFDLRQSVLLKERIEILQNTPINGYDHAFLFSKPIGELSLESKNSHIKLDVTTNYPAVVIFTHNIPFKDHFDPKYGNGIHSSIAIECQYEPGGIHFHGWNRAILRRGQTYSHWTNYHFTILKDE